MIMKRILRPLFLLAFTSIILYSCGSTALVSTPIANIDNTPTKFNDLTEAEEKVWGHLDLVKDTIPGMSIQKARDVDYTINVMSLKSIVFDPSQIRQ